ncbi:unnamed protein product, partial [Ectocarpus sp. 6 AP-2014]
WILVGCPRYYSLLFWLWFWKANFGVCWLWSPLFTAVCLLARLCVCPRVVFLHSLWLSVCVSSRFLSFFWSTCVGYKYHCCTDRAMIFNRRPMQEFKNLRGQ